MQKQQIIQQFETKCHEHNLRITPQRLAIYMELVEDKSHPTADDIFNRVKTDHPHISFDTVNRTLLSFAKLGLIQTVEGNGKPRRYDPGLGSHHHFHCLKCNRIIDFEDSALDDLKLPAEIIQKHQVQSQRIVVQGICQNCLNST